ncbi:MAG: hypothetical protein AAGA64_00205 [Bacteroidota bacterium]
MEVRSIEAIVKALNDVKVKYLIVGGLAVNAHGFVRMTRDLDLVLQLETSNCSRGLQALINLGYELAIPEAPEAFSDPESRKRWKNEKNMIVLKLWSDEHARTPVDLFIYEPFDFEKEYSQAMLVEVGPSIQAPFVGLKALLDMKRSTGRSADEEDIRELERIKEHVDEKEN